MEKRIFKTVITTALMTMLIWTSQAQSPVSSNIRFGFQASFLSFSWLSTNETTVTNAGSPLWGLKLGVLGEKSFADNYSLTFGLGFHFNTGGRLLFEDSSRLWTSSTYAASNVTLPRQTRAKYNLQYLEIPIGLKMRTTEFGRIRYFAEPHLGVAVLTQARGTVESNVDYEKINISDAVNPVMLSWGIGGGAEYNISGNTTAVVGIYYTRGFTDVTKDSGSSFLYNGKWQTETSKAVINSFTIRTAIMF